MLAEATETLASSYEEIIEDSVRENRIDDALNTLQDLVSNLAPELKNSALMLRRRHSQYKQSKPRNVAQSTELDSITEDLLAILDQARRRAVVTPRHVPGQQVAPSVQVIPIRPAPPAEVRWSFGDTVVSGLPHPEGSRTGATSVGEETLEEQLRNHWRRFRDSRPPGETTALVCEKIKKGYRTGNFQLDELSFTLRTGQITGVVGRNASGKTTLLRMLQGETAQDSGSLRYPSLTRDEESWPHIKRQIAYIPQFPEAWGGRVRNNLKYLAAAHGSRGKRNTDLVDWYIQRYGLANYENSPWSELSGGYRMRYELVRALISRPRLLVLDEPLASLDVQARQEFLKNLLAIAYSLEEPVPIIVTSQHLYEIEAIADQMIILDDGRCLFCGSLDDLQVQSSLQLYELNIRSSKRWILQILEGTQIQILETISDGYILGIPKETSAQLSIKLLVERFGDRLIGIRDITGSSRRFFIDVDRKGLAQDGRRP